MSTWSTTWSTGWGQPVLQYLFTTPSPGLRRLVRGPASSGRSAGWDRFMSRLDAVQYETNVWQDAAGAWHEGVVDTSDPSIQVYYLGGRTHVISEAEKTALETAGYTVEELS